MDICGICGICRFFCEHSYLHETFYWLFVKYIDFYVNVRDTYKFFFLYMHWYTRGYLQSETFFCEYSRCTYVYVWIIYKQAVPCNFPREQISRLIYNFPIWSVLTVLHNIVKIIYHTLCITSHLLLLFPNHYPIAFPLFYFIIVNTYTTLLYSK